MYQTPAYSKVQTSTGARSSLTLVIPLALTLTVGTGGLLDPSKVDLRKEGLLFAKRDAAPVASTQAFDVDRIRETLHLSMREIGDAIGVTRQAIYNWKNGGEIKGDNAVKLASLMDAAKVIAESDVAIPSLALRRKISGGQTLLDIVASGGDGGAAAHTLLEILATEAKQRKLLNERLAGRKSGGGLGLPPLEDA
ncbi:MAG: helix-turn-helix transcriptional regulator [Proteobacteria bacterium]|nr:helix-turn-helix transcriptional regulator [Pseudomonadota bacterium]